MNLDDYLIASGEKPRLAHRATDVDGGYDKDQAKAALAKVIERFDQLQELLFAEHKHSVLVVLQAMDAAGKDSTIREVFGPLNAQGCHVFNFKAPNDVERDHDFLWRIHKVVPPRGYIHVFNRSHYEDVVVVRVKGLVEKARWQARYEHINAFEKMLADEGVTIVKFYLHISKEFQRERLQKRLDEPDKRWKFNPGDLEDRARWDEFMAAFDDALGRCSTPHAPWYVIPAEKRWYRDVIITQVMVRTLEQLDMKFPALTYDPAKIVIE